MNNNNLFRLNYNYYERHLSPFGKKVLQSLIQNWHKERQNYTNNRPQNIPVQRKRVLQFNDTNTNINRTTTSRQTNPRSDYNSNTQINPTPGVLDETVKSIEPVKTIDLNNDPDAISLTRDDLINSVNIAQISADADVLYDKETEYDNVDISNVLSNNEVVKETNTVAWDDLFDPELLVSDGKAIDQFSESHLEERQFLFNFSKLDGKDDNLNSVDVRNETEVAKQKTKRKKEKKSTDTLSKKPKKVTDNPQKFLRKRKYTKAVKSWLNDVSPNNPADEEAINEKDPIEPNRKMNEIVVEKTKTVQNKKPKKVVQAQLTNKDGIMKFRKPKNSNIDSEVSNEKPTVPNEDKIKDKKAKPKFVAPIKSQIPVKDVTYEIHVINDNDFRKYNLKIHGDVDQECFAVLVYSNNFNQLNCHHTDDSCEVDALMINIDNVFYYIKEVTDDSKELLETILEHKLICYEAKDIINYLASKTSMNISPTSIVDVKIGVSLLNPDDPPDNFSEVQKLLSFTPQYTIATECTLQKTAWYITLMKECVLTMTDLLIQSSLWHVFVNIEMRLLPVVAAMEHRGVTVDLQKLKSMEHLLVTKMKAVEQSCYTAAGRSFQINSPLQIRAILYDELQLDTRCNVKIRETLSKGAKSTSEAMLRTLVSEHPLPRLILEYRHLHKAHATFLSGIAHHVERGVVSPTWVQTAAVTGRIASNNPNLQAIPKAPFNLVVFPEDNDEVIPQLKFRSVYTSRFGYSLVAADFKHVECRVFAHMAADTSLLDALRGKQDLFRVLASKWLQKPDTEVSSEDRERTKRIVYASLYGAGARKLMDILNISYDQTLAIVASFNRTFPSLKSFGRFVVSRCEQNGGRLSTICGRVRHFKHISSDDFNLRSQAERQAVNFIVQASKIHQAGSAADICKVAMVETDRELRDHNPAVEAHLLLQIHDELVWEVKDGHVDTVVCEDIGYLPYSEGWTIIKVVMENCGTHCGMSIALPIDIRIGKNWGEMTQLTQ